MYISVPTFIVYYILGFISCLVLLIVISKRMAKKEMENKKNETMEFLKYLESLKDKTDDKDKE